MLASLITTVVITVIRGVITGNWEFSFGATFTDDGDVSLNFGSGPFNTGPIPRRTTSDFSNITLRSAADLGSTLNVSLIEFSTTFIPTTSDTRNLDFSNVSFPYLSTSNSNNLNSGLFPDYIINQRINPNAPVQIAGAILPGSDWLTEKIAEGFVYVGATLIWAGSSLLNLVNDSTNQSLKVYNEQLRNRNNRNSPTFGSIDLGNKNFPLPPDFVAIDPAQLNFSPNRISLLPNTGIQHTGHPPLSPEAVRDLTQLGGFDLSDFRIPYDTAHDVYNDPKQFDPNTTFPLDSFDRSLFNRPIGFPDVSGAENLFIPVLNIELSDLPPVPIPSSSSPISMDEAFNLAQQFSIPGIPMRVIQSSTGYQVIQTTTNSMGQTIVRRIGFDVNPTAGHVRILGPHLNLQTQVDGRPQTGALADPHIPIDSSTVKPSDY